MLNSAADQITVRAKAIVCTEAPQLIVKVDGIQVQNSAVSATNWIEIQSPVKVASGTHTVSIGYGGPAKTTTKCQQKLYVDKIAFLAAVPDIKVEVIKPTEGSTVTDGVPVEAQSSSSAGISKVEFYLDGQLRATDITAPYCMEAEATSTTCKTWDSSGVADGQHTLKVKAYDSTNATAEAMVTFTVQNTVTISIDRSAPNATSNWIPGHTVVSNEFYYPFGQNQGPDTLTDTAQYKARALELEGVTQHNVHLMAWGRQSPWLKETDPPPNPAAPYNTDRWGGQGLDQEIKRAVDGGLTPTITLAMAPGWMVGKRTANNGIVSPVTDWSTDFFGSRITPDKLPQWLQLVDGVVRRYSSPPYNVRTYDIWNEFKGYYNPDINNYDAGIEPGTPGKADMGYTYFYNQTRQQILASAAAVGVNEGIRTGGPYVVNELWDISSAGGYPVRDARGSANDTLSGAKSYGWVDSRPLEAIKTWLANKSGAEFISLRFSNVTRSGITMGNDWDSLLYARDLASWIRGLPEGTYPGAATLPLWNAEHYTVPNDDASNGDKLGAFSAESYRIGVRSGYEAMLRWGSAGLDGVTLWTTTSVTNNKELRVGDGLPGNGQETQKLFKQNFAAGTALYPETVSSPEKVSVLANGTDTLLINKTNMQLTVSVNGVTTTLMPYGVMLIKA